MNYTAQQTAEKLGLTVSQVRTRMLQGHLRDVSPKAGQGKHILYFDQREVEEYKRTLKASGHPFNGNGNNGQRVPAPTPLLDDIPPLPPPVPPGLLAARRRRDLRAAAADALEPNEIQLATIGESLNRIADSLERLVTAWK